MSRVCAPARTIHLLSDTVTSSQQSLAGRDESYSSSTECDSATAIVHLRRPSHHRDPAAPGGDSFILTSAFSWAPSSPPLCVPNGELAIVWDGDMFPSAANAISPVVYRAGFSGIMTSSITDESSTGGASTAGMTAIVLFTWTTLLLGLSLSELRGIAIRSVPLHSPLRILSHACQL